MKVTIFFSWQSTTPSKFNRNFILNCIDKAVKKFRDQPEFKDIQFIIQEGVSGESGSVQIARTIAEERIPQCDIFIADLSIINAPPKLIKFIHGLFRYKQRLVVNDNVMYEYGIAKRELGENKIIGVLNKVFGSPKDNIENIPFDIRHQTFPIEYEYSSRTKNVDYVKKNLISKLHGAIKSATEYAIKQQKLKYLPLIPWSEWAKAIKIEHNFIANKKNELLRNELKDFVVKSRKNFRIIGMPGIGKTRALFEIFKEDAGNDSSKFMSARVLYADYNQFSNHDFSSLLQKIVNDRDDQIIILDNCPKDLHRKLKNLVESSESKISLITVGPNPEEIYDQIGDIEYFVIKREEFKDVADKIITDEVALIGEENLERVKEFAQGNSLMATLLIKSIKSGEKIVGKLEDKDLLDRLLGENGTDQKNRKILRSCSIFSYVGFEDDQKEQIDFIATNKNITSLDGSDQVLKDDFLSLCQFYIKREIIEQRGRYIGIRPLPLAMYLAQEWMETCNDEKFLRVITDIAALQEPHRHRLSEAFAEQMKYLGYDDRATQIVEKIVGQNGPFDNAEVLNTELGSRLFRSFVEVNPVAISENLYRNYIEKSTAELLDVRQGRRNLIWTLEKLCFDSRTFNKSALILFKFAVAENENISNNATGQFLQLFNIQLPGTEANLAERLNIINWGFEKKDEKFRQLTLSALSIGLKCRDFRRMGGAEHQGTKVLKDYEPNTAEVINYFSEIISLLKSIYGDDVDSRNKIENIILDRVRGLCREGLGMLILPFMEELASNKHFDWQTGLNTLRLIESYDFRFIDDEAKQKIEQLIHSLTKDDFLSKYLDSQRYRSDRINFEESNRKLIQAASDLADEFLDNAVEWNDVFPVLFSKNEGVPGFYFGKRLFERYGENVEQKWKFILTAFDTLSAIPEDNRNISIIIGFLADANHDVLEKVKGTLIENKELSSLLFEILGNRSIKVDELDALFGLVDSGRNKITDLSHIRSIRSFSVEEIEILSDKLFAYGKDGYETIFHILFDYSFRDEVKKGSLTHLFKKCYLELGVGWVYQTNMDYYKWFSVLIDILKNEKDSEFAEKVNRSFIESINGYRSFTWEHNVIGLYYTLMEFHFNAVWPYLSEILLSSEKDYDKYHALTSILESNISATKEMSHVGVLFRGDIGKIFEWCHANSPAAPTIIAELTPIFDGNNDDFNNWHPVATRLIDEFGNIRSVLSNISANMGSYSWIGSVVPYLSVQKALFTQLTNHPIREVSEWANAHINYLDRDIKQEKIRDEEERLR